MNFSEFNKILDKTTNQFFIFSTKITRPKYFVKHLYIATNQKGEINRFEVYSFKNKKNPDLGHIHKNFTTPTTGHRKKLFNRKEKYNSELIQTITGQLAEDMNKFVNKQYINYKYKNEYQYIGNNCNTFVDWILKEFPQVKIKLPKTAIGKKFK